MTTLKRFLTLFLVVFLAVNVWGADETVTFSSVYSADDKPTVYNGTNFSITFDKGTNSNAPIYKTTGAAVRIYGGGYFEVSSTTKNINKIELTFGSGDGSNAITTNGGSFTSNTWTGSATSVRFTIGGTTGHRRLASVAVTYASGGGTPTLSSIAVKTAPTKVSYTEGEFFDPAGLVITRTYSDDTHSDWTYADHTSDFTFSPSLSTALTTSDASVTITYSGKSTTQAITVTSGGGGGCSYDLSTNSYVSASTTLVSWTSHATATMTLAKGTSGTNANNYIPTTRTSTRFYSNQVLTITPKSGKNITSIIFTAATTGYASVLANSDWSNATASASGSEVTVTPTDGTSAVSATIGGTCGFTCVEFVEGSIYTITATVDDPAHGSVSVSGNTITVSPNDGFIPDGYTVTSGTATASQNGNTYTVTPSEDCTIRIDFREAAIYTVKLVDNGGSHNETATEGVPFELPDEGLSTCDDVTFLGWVRGSYTDHESGTSTKPDYENAGASVSITANTTFTAVYGVVAPSNNYAALKLESDLESGANYVLAAYYSSNDYAMKATMSNDRVDTEVKSLILGEAGNAITDSYLIWRINIVNPSTKAVTFYNAEINKYLVINGSNEIDFADDPIVFNYTVNTSGAAATWNFKSSSNAEYTLSFYTTYHQFNAYTSNSTSLYLYKQKVEVSNYTSKPKCCQAPSTPMAISSETTNFEGSGSTTISLTGGNGKPITWSCKDELDSPCDYLTGTSSTGATLTLPANAATKVYTVTASQADDETDPDNVICGATVTLDFTVKAQFTINFKTIDGGSESLYHSITVTDGDTYEMPSLAEDFDCGTSGKSFMGWASANDASSVEKTAGTIVTATAAATWYACWATSADVTLVPLYEKVTSASSLAASDIVLICNTGATVAIGEQNTSNRAAATVTSYEEESKDYVYFTGTDVRELTVGKDGDHFTFHDATEGGYLYAASSSSNHMKTQASNNDNGKWELVIAADGAATVTAQGTNSHKIMRYNTGNSIFSCYSSGQQAVVFYKKTSKTKSVSTGSGSITTDMDGCASGPTIRANTNQWITSAAGQTVKTVIDVTAKNFETAVTLSATSSNDKFFISLADTDVPTGVSGLTTTLTVEYTPTTSDETESSTITLKAGEITKTITVNGRTLPEEFLLITKKTLWYALPGNMNDGPGEYDGVVVTTDDPTTPTMVGVSPSTVLYSLKAVTSDRYADHGNCVRLVGYNDLCLWSNHATSEGSKINIQNKTNVATASGNDYEWLLTTTDGVQYTIANPNHPQYGAGRRLAYGTKFGLYTEPTIFYIVTAGCTSQPQNVGVSARRVDATFTWVSNTAAMTIEIYSDEERTSLVKSETATSVPYSILGLTEKTDYWYKLIPGTDEACAVYGTFKTTGPVIDIVEWEVDNAVIFVDKDDAVTPKVIIDGEVEHGVGTGAAATELFFSKYFEGSGDMKLVAIFNGTANDISLSNYTLYTKNCSAPKKESDIAASSFSSQYDYPIAALGTIKAGQEIIFFTRPNETKTPELHDCSDSFLDAMALESGADKNPRWIECDNSTFYGGSKFPLMQFNGNDAICLAKNSTLIDVIGSTGDPGKVKNCADRLNDLGWTINVKNIDYGKASNDPAFYSLFAASSLIDETDLASTTDGERKAVLAGFKVDLESEYIDLTTARCILFRDKSVTSGEKAVALNTGDAFTTCNDFTYKGESYKSEWNGRQVCMSTSDQSAAGVSNDSKATCNSYQDLGVFNYSEYYKEWNNIDPGLELDEHVRNADEKTYDIPIPNLAKYSCLNIRFQLKDGEEVLTETPVQVPILVTGSKSTDNAIFNEIVKTDLGVPVYDQSINRCKTCDVVVLGDGILTKQSGTTSELEAAHDVPEIGNLKIYPGGKLIVPSGTEYTVNSLSFRRQEDEVASANIQGTLNVGTTNGTYLDFRIDPTNWHYFSLPYNCNVADIRFANGDVQLPVIGTDYLLKWYNGEKRAATQAGGCWEMVAADATLKKGIGYIFALPGDGKVKREFRFPMANAVIADDKVDKNVAGIYGYGCDKDYTQVRANHRGWNLLGNPYFMPYSSDITDPLLIGKIVPDYSTDPWDGHYKFDETPSTQLRYIVEPVDNGRSEYRQVAIANYEMTPFTCYFVQIGADDPGAPDPTLEQGVEFHVAKVDRSSIVRRNPAEYEETEDTHPVWCQIDLTNPQGETDNTTMLISNDFTDGYDIMNDLVKMRGTYYQYAQITTKPVLASRNNEGEMAFNALPDSSALAGIPLNFFAAGSGSYTFSFNECYGREEVKAVMLLDKNNNQWYNLLDEPYSFTTNRVDDKNRFVLSVRVERKKPQTPTDIVNPSVMGDGSAPRKILINNRVYILRGGKIYDVTGKQLLNL